MGRYGMRVRAGLVMTLSASLLPLRSGCVDCGSVRGALLFEQGKEPAIVLVILLDPAGENVVIPAMNRNRAVGKGSRHGGLGLQIEELGHDIAPNERSKFGVLAIGGIGRLAMAEGGLYVVQPAARLGQMLEPLAIEGGFHGAAVGVAAKDRVLNFENFDSVFDGGGGAVDIGGRNGHYVAGVPGNEQIAWAGA